MVFASHILCISHGVYIPQVNLIDELLSFNLQTDLDEGTKILRPRLDLAIRSYNASVTSSWRNSAFHPPPDGGEFGAGVLNMSPGWFQRLQDVSLFLYKQPFVVLAYFIC